MSLKIYNSKAKIIEDGVYRIEAKSEKNSALQKFGNLANINKWNGYDNQKWKFTYIAPGYLVTEGYIISTLDGKEWLSWDKDNNKVIVKPYDNTMTYTRKWTIVSNSDSTFTFKNTHYPNPILTSNGMNNSVNVSSSNGSDKQKFYLTKDPLDPNIENSGSLAITSDPQYPWTDKTDNNESETESEQRSRSYTLISNQYNSINSYTNSVEKSSILINGDITAFGHSWQRDTMTSLLSILEKAYYYGLGNHDIINNYNDCFDNVCAAGSFHNYVQHVLSLNLPESHFDIKKDSRIPQLTIYEGSFSYSIDFGKIYAIQLNCYPGMESSFYYSSGLHSHSYKMTDNINWLENELKLATNQNKSIIINVHYPDKFSDKYKNLLNDYNVKAIFAGHYHKSAGNFSNLGSIPIFLSGSASQSTYLIVEYDNKDMNIYLVKNNDWKNKNLIKTIDIS
ncbi:hypothetical protein D4A35_18115 (plasmid) [Paraclostridium bifermentans]|uniref:Calcineurin-like phosphoesterase domain-containing protein n=1 Tax=Paraclostridium bifermentans TaxID=1490 RepID=A0A5P3XKH7_PARBF|nr:metallophosphoesterase [Paraclostridium bifermentans]QEZ70851.1 hypothetical protein D4A35_18115 [Paraclostridium bifermentans]